MSFSRPRSVAPAVLTLLSGLAATALTACGEKTSGTTGGTAATIDQAAVTNAATVASTLFSLCRSGGALQADAAPLPNAAVAAAQLPHFLTSLVDGAVPGRAVLRRTIGLTGSKPADRMGSCGGRASYTGYSHTSGTTTGNVVYEDYCTTDNVTGERTTLNGTLSFRDVGTPGDVGPVRQRVEASSTGGITETTRSAAGVVQSSSVTILRNVALVRGTPGAVATTTTPDRVTADEIEVVNQTSGKRYRETNVVVTYAVSGGNDQLTVASRSYRSDGTFFDVSTDSPLVITSSGTFQSGQFAFTGAGGNKAVVTVVPSTVLQGTVLVNGQPVTGLPACR